MILRERLAQLVFTEGALKGSARERSSSRGRRSKFYKECDMVCFEVANCVKEEVRFFEWHVLVLQCVGDDARENSTLLRARGIVSDSERPLQ